MQDVTKFVYHNLPENRTRLLPPTSQLVPISSQVKLRDYHRALSRIQSIAISHSFASVGRTISLQKEKAARWTAVLK